MKKTLTFHVEYRTGEHYDYVSGKYFEINIPGDIDNIDDLIKGLEDNARTTVKYISMIERNKNEKH